MKKPSLGYRILTDPAEIEVVRKLIGKPVIIRGMISKVEKRKIEVKAKSNGSRS